MEPQHRPVSDAGKLSLHFCSGPRKTRGVRGVKSLESGPPFGPLESAFLPLSGFLVPFCPHKKELAVR